MLFNSYEFICVFLPITWVGFGLLARGDRRWAGVWLVVCSLAFYGWWNPVYLILLCSSIAVNFAIGEAILANSAVPRRQTALLIGGVCANLALLFWFKYLFPVLDFLSIEGVVPESWTGRVVLPLGISFFTFTQIGYLIDCREQVVRERSFRDYSLFVTFFPHLIAGPILHHKEIMPQFAAASTYKISLQNVAVGMTLFLLGLAKKVLIADQLVNPVSVAFGNPDHAEPLVAWLGVLSYSLQLYFDFSGYSDMAIGLARLFGVRFPLNFNSPYKAQSIIEFWQRWHMTLTRYLTLYLYNPVAMAVTRRRLSRGLGISKQATANVPAFLTLIVWPTLFTMTLAGIWHGAGLQFLVFGVLHGIYLSVNHAWRVFGPKPAHRKKGKGAEETAPMTVRARVLGIGRLAASAGLTYLCVLIAQVFFRSASAPDAVRLLAAMCGKHAQGESTAGLLYPSVLSLNFAYLWAYVLVGFAIVWFMPNTQEIMANYEPTLAKVRTDLPERMRWRMSWTWAVGIGALGALAFGMLGGPTEFLYFEF